MAVKLLDENGAPRQATLQLTNGMHPNPLILAVFDLMAIALAISWMVRHW